MLPKDRPGPNLQFRFMKNCIHTSLLGSLVKIDEDGDVVNKTIVSIQEIITKTIISKQEKEDPADKEPNNAEGKGYKIK